jgi:PAS domain S-box-containing protein
VPGRADSTTSQPALEENAEELFENAPCGYLSTLPGGTILRVNQTFLRWTGHRREDLVGRKRFEDLLTVGGRIYHETHYAPLLHMQGMVREVALEFVCADGRRQPALVSAGLKRDADGRPLVTRIIVFPAVDRREYERELLRARQKAEQADRVKADFISMISHEVRTPLNAIVGVSHLLQATELSPQQQRYVHILRSSSETLLATINEILDFSKVESGRASLEQRSFDLRTLVHGVASSLSLKAEEKGVALAVDVDERLPPTLVGDPVKVQQVLMNLVGNAVKFTTQGSVTVAVRVRDRVDDSVTVHFRVSDTGIGIAPERLPHIFDPFTQASYDVGVKYGGTGLGLAISKRLVELHGSRLAVASEPGRGSTFSFVLRFEVPAAP